MPQTLVPQTRSRGRAVDILDASGRPFPRQAPPPTSLRGWQAARVDRLNQAHWQHAHGMPINEDLRRDLQTLCTFCEFEAQNNPMVAGVIATHANDVVGPDGPTLQIHSDNDAYNTALEQIHEEWFAMPDFLGQLSGADMLKLDVRLKWTRGEYLEQFVDAGPDWMIGLRLHAIAPRRLSTPPGRMLDTQLGISLDKFGRPLAYWIEDIDERSPFGWTGRYIDPAPGPADIIHGFERLEPGQVRGVPLLASALDCIADLRDYDAQVLDAARNAADYGVYFYTDHPNLDPIIVNESIEIERRMATTAPPGWKPSMVQATQPTTNYVEFRSERQRDIGRPVGMPLMSIRLDSSQHSYSSARFDGQVYQRGCVSIRSQLEREKLNRCLDLLAREAEMAGLIPPRPRRVKYAWTWMPFPHVDPAREMLAAQLRLQTGISSLSDEIAATGGNIETLAAKRKRDAEVLAAAGFTYTISQGGIQTITSELDKLDKADQTAAASTSRAYFAGAVQ